MNTLEIYLDIINEDFSFNLKTFKIDILRKMVDGIKKNIKGKKVNIQGIKKVLRPIPLVSQDKINKFLQKYVPNYQQDYNKTERYFKKKYPKVKHPEVLASTTVLAAAANKEKTLNQQIARTDRLYSSYSDSGGGAAVLFVMALGVLMAVFSGGIIPEEYFWMAIVLGSLLILVSISAAMR